MNHDSIASVSSGTSTLSVTPTWRWMSVTRANTWKRVAPPVTPWRISVGRSGGGSVGSSSPRPNGDGIQSIAERKQKYSKPIE